MKSTSFRKMCVGTAHSASDRDRRLDAGQVLDDIAGHRIVFAAQQAGELDSTCLGAQLGTKIAAG
ncbi:hypothetical protein [Pseudonocardia sp. T1-2H]|uniref:hypothetical protein n=1 Tax=Pseudonocardia sp. T1-2H TaxID=3128899 RepID=UPI003101162F